jgi:hypothetical protein
MDGSIPGSTVSSVKTSSSLTGLALLIDVTIGTRVSLYLSRRAGPERIVWEAAILVSVLMPPLALGILLSFAFGSTTAPGAWLLRMGLATCNSAHRGDDLHLRPRRGRRALTVEDYYAQKKRWWLRLREKNGKLNEMPCHHKLESYLDAYIEAAGIEGDRKGPLFRAAVGKTRKLGQGAMSRTDVWYMVRRRAADAGIETAIGCHTFRATGITDYLMNGGRIEVAQRSCAARSPLSLRPCPCPAARSDQRTDSATAAR